MKAVVTLPYGYGRAYSGKDKFVKSAPTFNVEVFGDDGNRIQEAYPSAVQMGPDMYKFLSKIMPALAARRNEDLTYEGKVVVKPRKAKERYAYYGFGHNPLSKFPISENQGVGLIGFGDTPVPNYTLNRDLNSSANQDSFLYSAKLDAPSPHGSNSRSKVLTNILNDSWDFSPLLAPLYKYTDPEYNEKDDIEGKGPRPTDHWVPRVDPATGKPILKEDGSYSWMPIPLVQDMPIYNLKHPMWSESPEAAWNMINDTKSALDWHHWNKAPSYADYTGATARTDKGDIRPRDYLMTNLKLAKRPGYFEDYADLDLKSNAYSNFLDAKGQRSIEDINEAREQAIKEFEQDKLAEDQQRHNERFYRPDDSRHTGLDKQGKYYKSLIHNGLLNPEVLNQFAGDISHDDEKAVKKFIMRPGSFSKYNQIGDDESKLIAILSDYSKDKKNKDSQQNILSGVKEPFN